MDISISFGTCLVISIYFVFLIKIFCLLQESQVKNKHYLHSRHLAFYFVYWSELEFLNNLWGLETELEQGYRTGPPGYIGWRN
jgi:hypothetical protein